MIDPQTGKPFDPSIPTAMALAANKRQVPFNTGRNIADVLGDLWDASKLAGLTPEFAPVGGAPNIPVATKMATQAAGQASKAGAREIAKQIENRSGVFGNITIDPRMYAYKPTAPSKPLPEGVGQTSFEMAHLTAQKNAALPIEQGGLGLPANNTAMDRAKALGFDTSKTWYHGTDAKDFNLFNPMIYLSESPSEASAYGFVDNLINKEKTLSKYKINPSTKEHGTFAKYSGILSDIDSPKIGNLYATDNGVFKYRGNGKWDAMTKLDVDYNNYDKSTDSMKLIKSNKGEALNAVNETIAYANETFPRGVGGRVIPLFTSTKNPIELGAYDANVFGKRLGATDKEISNALSKYKNQGYDSIKTLSDAASFYPDAKLLLGGIPEQKIIFNPNQLRSPYAAFDPFRRNEADILAGLSAVDAGLLATDKDKKKKK